MNSSLMQFPPTRARETNVLMTVLMVRSRPFVSAQDPYPLYVDNSFAPGIGKRLDGWANRDLNVGVIVSLAPNLKPFTDLLGAVLECLRCCN